MASFSERHGYMPVNSIIQRESADEALRNSLWNLMVPLYFLDPYSPYSYQLIRHLWSNFYKNRIDEFDIDEALSQVKTSFIKGKWFMMYDLIEYIPPLYADISGDPSQQLVLLIKANEVLKNQLSAYRLVNDKIVEITSEEEIAEIESASNITIDKFTPVKSHIRRALELLSDRITPDYRNSIKESISAVESLSSIIANEPKASLGQALKIIDKKQTLHPSLKSAFEKLYGYTSDADGIRHGLLASSELKQEDAKFMLVACSAFVNYLIAKSDLE